MRLGLRLLVVSVSVLLLGGVAVNFLATAPAASMSAPPDVPLSTGSSPKVHVAEVLTGVWCPPCGVADPALNRIVDEWRDDLILIAYHCCNTNPANPNYDPFYDSTILSPRSTFYTWPYLPFVVIDGGGTYGNDDPLFLIGSAGTTASTYDMYRFALEDSTDPSSNVAVAITGDLTPSGVTATIAVTATDAVPQTNLYLRTVLYEDALYWTQTNGRPVHRHVARALNEQLLGSGSLAMGQTVTQTVSFPLNPAWKPNKLGIASFVQSSTKRAITLSGYTETYYVSDILNAAKHDFVRRGVLVMWDRGPGSDYSEVYEDRLAFRNEHFDTWNTHVVGTDTGTTDAKDLPSASVLAKTPLLFWNTAGSVGSPGTPILTQSERDMIQAYLDNGRGNLLIAGANLGFDGTTNYRTWFQTYLHATYNSDDTGEPTVHGVAGDPISNAWASTNLNVLSSPDRISAFGEGAAVPFVYASGVPGSVRAQHDADSRVVYLGFQYFENTVDTNRADILGAILDWLDGAAPPKVSVFTPSMCQVVSPGSTFRIRWDAADVRIPANGVDILWSSDGGASWVPIASGEPNDGVYTWTVPSAATPTARIKVVAHDSAGNTAEAATAGSFIISSSTTGVTCTMPFSSSDVGWRLVSFPLIPTNPSASSILSSLGGSYDVARTYVSGDTADPWKAFVPTKTGNDLSVLDQKGAFWVRITGPGTLSVVGDVPTSPQHITLHRGWNLVGFPSYRYGYTVADLKAATGATRVEGFDPSATPYYLRALPDDYILRTGEGYWVYVPMAAQWTVPV